MILDRIFHFASVSEEMLKEESICDLEEEVYADGDYEDDYVCEEIACPNCGTVLPIDTDIFEEEAIHITCPTCNEDVTIELDDEDYDDDFLEDCDGDCFSCCEGCGEELPDGMKFCPNCGTPAPLPKVACPGCGKEYDEGTRFCMDCGAQLQ